ncbi:MAG: hypothetical protein L0Z62_46615 [Gemmataceae bacterium]|nr:hypothetical protein [Gemmataceae bacterium]
MSAHTRWLAAPGLLVALVLGSASHGQPPPSYPSPYPGYGGGFYPGRAGGYQYGNAAVINAYGNLGQQNQEARITAEQAKQANLDTKKKTLDYMNYERANKPTYADDVERNQALLLRRVLNQPTEKEVTSGKALNIIMPYLQTLASQGIMGPPIPLSSEVIRNINVTAGSSASLGPVKNGKVEWPRVLLGPQQEKVDALLPAVIGSAAENKIDLKLFDQLTEEVAALRKDLKDRFANEKIDGTAYLTGQRLLDPLEAAVKRLGEPGAARFLTGASAARGRNVPELVMNMSKDGLSFAAVSPGNEADYFALHRSFASYAAGAQSNSSFRAQAAPPNATGFVPKGK